ncbi:MAG: hypothetical protein KGI75_03180 [Rhizobiaceae bacterium]|nr:hypothetical protein [Rhizobiaceae bacterium]
MRKWVAVAITLAAIAFIVFFLYERSVAPTLDTNPSPPQAEAPVKLRSFSDAHGHEAQFSTPLLDAFNYPGDRDICERFDTLKAALGPYDVLNVGDCGDLSSLPSVDKSVRLTKLAQQLYTLSSANPQQSEDEKDGDIALALSSLKEALDVLPPDAATTASAVLESNWLAGLTSDHFPHYDPPFLFGSAFAIEAGEAQLTLCPLVGRDDCAGYIPPGLIDALTEVGRWRSNDAPLVRAADLLEQRNANTKDATTEQQLSFAEDFSAALGYAAEIVTGDQSIAYLRRGVAPMAQWLEANQHGATDYMLSRATTSLGAQYGRIADRTNDKADAEKAVKYDSWAYQLKQGISQTDGWAALANLGDSVLLKAEIDHDEAGFRTALQHHRDALAMAQKIGDQEDIVYSKMKLARTLLHYEQAPDLSLTKDDRVAMLNESITLAREIIPFMDKTGTKVYANITRDILSAAEKNLTALQADASKSGH